MRWWWQRKDEDFAREIQSHLELEADRLVSDGVPPAKARVTAQRRFGNVATHKERFYESRRILWWDQIRQDVRYAARSLLKTPGFTGVAVLTLALGIGANMAVFSVVHAVLLNAFVYPVEEPDRVLFVAERSPQGGQMGVSYPTFRDWVEQLESFEVVSGYRDTTYTLTGNHEPLRVRARQTSFTYFGLHGIQPLHGRLYVAADDRFGAARVAVLNHQLWQERFGGRPDVMGETVLLNDNTHTVIGVLPPDIDLTQEVLVYTPLESWAGTDNNTRHRGNHSALYVLGRLGPGVTFEQARAELTATAARFEAEYPDTNTGVGVIVHRLPEWRLRNYRTILWVLQAAVVILWLIACTNVANLMLARAVIRRRQYAISAALGAGPLRTLRQLLVENLLLSLTAAGVGLILALGAVQILRTMTPFDIPRLAQAQLNWPVVAFGSGLAILAGLVAGLLPGMRVARQVDVTSVLNEDGATARGGGGGRRPRPARSRHPR